MGIGDLFKRFKSNTATLEDYGQNLGYEKGGVEESQATRATHEGEHASQDERANEPDES